MKTLNSFLMIALFVTMGTVANANTHFESVVKNSSELKNLIGKKFDEDLKHVFNYLYEKDVRSLDENVKVTFTISREGVINVVKVDCDNCDAADYAKKLLHQAKFNVSDEMLSKRYVVNIKLKYKAV
jgi:hypothetical protein